MSPIKDDEAEGMRNTHSLQSGFTLIELLLATMLFLAAAATVTVFMAQGIRLFTKLSAASQEEEAAVCVAKMTRDMRNMVYYTLIPFEGGAEKISFASLENLAALEGDADPSPFGVTYRYDTETKRIVRDAVRPQTFEKGLQSRIETLLSGVSRLKFDYEGDPQEIPRRVTIHIDYQGRFGPRSMTQEVLVPSAPVPLEEP